MDQYIFMTTLVGLLALGVALGIFWGRFSERLAIPELLRMLATPLFTGVVGLVFGFPLSLVVLGSKIRSSPHEGAATAAAISCFAAGMLLGLPAIFGWALGYRTPNHSRAARSLRSRRPRYRSAVRRSREPSKRRHDEWRDSGSAA
jgi:hypothetical protein